MKLIDLLVQELPKRGGWPDSSVKLQIVQDADKEIKFHVLGKVLSFERNRPGIWGSNSSSSWFENRSRCSNFHAEDLSDDYAFAKITREEYENALTKFQQPQWNGEGLPPIGCECEAKYLHAANAEWFMFRCVAVDCEVAFGWGGKEPANLKLKDFEFRPIQTEAKRERNTRIATLNNFISGFMKSTDGDYTNLGEAIYEWQNVLDKLKK